MGTVFKMEMRKAFSKKAYWIALAIMLLVLFANEITPIITGNFDATMEREKALSGTVVDDEFLSQVQQNEPGKEDPLTLFIKNATASTDITGHTSQELYARRTANNIELMKDLGLDKGDIQVWLNEDARNDIPFRYTYCTAYTSYFDMAGYMNFMVLILVTIGLAGMYADEKSCNMDQMIFCTKNGRRKLFGIKFAVGLILGVFTAVVLVAFEIAVLTGLYGLGGAETYIQILMPNSMMHMNMGESMIIMSVFFIMEAVILSMAALALSQLTMSHVATIACMIFLMFLAMFNIPESLGLLYMLCNSIPGATVGSWMFYDYHLIGSLNNLEFIPILWAVLAVVIFLVARTSYNRYQIKAR